MKVYRIACDWSVYSTMFVKANSLEEAKIKAMEDEPLPMDGNFIDGSFEINEEMTEYFLEEDKFNEEEN